MANGKEWRPVCTCGDGAGEQGPNRLAMGVGGEDGSEGVGVIQEGTPEKPRTPPNEIRENAEGGLLAL
jgi:hypothetical protein